MAKNYLKSVDGGAENDMVKILEQQEALIMPIDATDWTQLRFGFGLSFTDGTSDNVDMDAVHKSATSAPFIDQYWMGMATAGTTPPNMVGTNGALFIGYAPGTGNSTGIRFRTGALQVEMGFSVNYRMQVVAVNPSGTKVAAGGDLNHQGAEAANQHLDTQFGSMYALDLSIQNDGLSTMTITSKYMHVTDMQPYDRLRKVDLLDELQTMAFTGASTVHTWNDGATAYDKPDRLFCCFPWSDVRARVHVAGVYKLAP